MKILKTLKYAFALALFIIGTSCTPEKIDPKQTNGEVQKIVEGTRGD